LLGDRLVGSEYLGLAARRGSEAEVARAAADWLAAQQPTWDLADLNGLRESDPAAREFESALRAGTARVDEQQHSCSAVALPGDFEDYLAGLSSKFRQTYRQRTNKLLRSCDVRFLRTESEAELPVHLDALFRLHQARWTRAGRAGSFADPRKRSFYDDVSRRLLRSGRLRLWHLQADGAIRASQFAFAYAGVLYSLQEAYDDQFRVPGIGGLGVVLRGQVLRAAIDERLHTYDFLGGVEDHKLRWGASVHTVRRVRLARRGPRGGAAWLATVGAGSVRGWVKSTLPEPVLNALKGARADYYRRRGRRG
jgi:CelD/BcsL family acetyltransferase involved in cellulose biosynthesis